MTNEEIIKQLDKSYTRTYVGMYVGCYVGKERILKIEKTGKAFQGWHDVVD